jgi:hypothetical protein
MRMRLFPVEALIPFTVRNQLKIACLTMYNRTSNFSAAMHCSASLTPAAETTSKPFISNAAFKVTRTVSTHQPVEVW